MAGSSAGISQAKLKMLAGGIVVWSLDALPSSFLLAELSWVVGVGSPFPCWLLARGLSQPLKATYIPSHVAIPTFKPAVAQQCNTCEAQ